jgi:dipeptidyl aminopeptidase/acylaminoacyl peptidase
MNPTFRRRLVLGCLIVLGAFVASSPTPSAQAPTTRRAFTVDDIFELEGVGRYYGGPYAFSPDGSRLAITRLRPKRTNPDQTWFIWDNATADVWVQMDPRQAPVRVTDGDKDGSGWWSTQWSPDGRRLAMLSTRGRAIHLWVWDSQSKTMRQVGKSRVSLPRVRERPYVWLNDRQLLFPTLAPGAVSQGMRSELRTPAVAMKAWPAYVEGKETTVSVLTSGQPANLEERQRGRLVVANIEDGSEREIASADTSGWVLAPDSRAVAYTRKVSVYAPKAGELLPFGASGVATVEVVTTTGERVAFQGDLSRDVIEESLRWSSDGNNLAFFGYAGSGRSDPPALYTLNIKERTVTRRQLAGVNAAPIVREQAQLEWMEDGRLILYAAKTSQGEKTDVTTRRDWWLVSGDDPPRVLTADMKQPPREIVAQDGRRSFVGVAAGEVWRLTPSTGKVDNLTADFTPAAAALAWPVQTNSGTDEYAYPSRTYTQVVFNVTDANASTPYRIDLATGRIDPIRKPSPASSLVNYNIASASAVFWSSNRDGLQIWRTRVSDGDSTQLVSANEFLRGIEEGEIKPIEYTSLDGKPLKAWLVLPFGYTAGVKYPLLTWVYAGSVMGAHPSPTLTINSTSPLNLHIASGRGYAVLLPSMPLAPEGALDDPMLRLPNGVLPAIDKVIQLGFADPARVYVMGQSFGGFSTYGLITQTSRFAAAVSLAGLSNLISLYSQFDARMRYEDYPHENLFQASLFESAQVRMGAPPWRDLHRYVRNSPVFFVDRVETPLMIIQGDQDYVALQQGEEFFFSLYRQGKRASFVRYWGEGHVLSNAANIRDMWKRVFAWFDEFPGTPKTGSLIPDP